MVFIEDRLMFVKDQDTLQDGKLTNGGLEEPQVCFGVISDIQYADVDDAYSAWGQKRYYRKSLQVAKSAARNWQSQNVQFAVNGGDIIDNKAQGKSKVAIDRVLEQLSLYKGTIYHAVGNHCLANFNREYLHDRLNTSVKKEQASYFQVQPHPRWKIIVLDGFDISIWGWPNNHKNKILADQILREKQSQKLTTGDSQKMFQERYAFFGGGLSQHQLEWLQQQLQESQEKQQKVIVFCHEPIFPGTCPNTCLLWNYDELLALFEKYQRTVVASFAGHSHLNGFKIDQNGVRHYVLPGVVESSQSECYGIVELYENGFKLKGYGECLSSSFQF